MAAPNPLMPILKRYLTAFQDHIWLWFVPTVGLTLMAACYAVVRQPSWEANQALLVRDEAIGAEGPAGRFSSVDNMKTAQETIMEVARSRDVVEASLVDLGAPSGWFRPRQWPSQSDIEDMQSNIKVSAPKGAEFGRTEVIYLGVKADSREEAVRRTEIVCRQLEIHLAQLRRARAESVIKELKQTVQLSEAARDHASKRLQEMEAAAGPDLGELRNLNSAGSAEGNLQHSLNQIKAELRQAAATREANLQLRQLLVRASQNPEQFLATPGRLLESQPALKRLKDGLVDAQLRTSALLGRMKETHPQVISATRAEAQIRNSLIAELGTALRGVETELEVGASYAEQLREQRHQLQQRLDGLADVRVEYSKRVEDYNQRSEVVKKAQSALADAEANQVVALRSSLLTRFQEPVAGDDPLGPGKLTIVAAGMAGGLATGIGLVLLVVPVTGGEGQGRRWSDYIGIGRRASDRQAPGRREQDQAAPQSRPPREAGECNRRAHDNTGVPKTDRRYGTRRREDRDEVPEAASAGAGS